MKYLNTRFILLLLLVSLFAACASGGKMGKSKNCGCGLNKGFVGY
jgi:hypothetical protein